MIVLYFQAGCFFIFYAIKQNFKGRASGSGGTNGRIAISDVDARHFENKSHCHDYKFKSSTRPNNPKPYRSPSGSHSAAPGSSEVSFRREKSEKYHFLSIVSEGSKMVVNGKKKKFACHICGKEYNTKQYVKQHVKSIHKTEVNSKNSLSIDPKTNNTTLLPQMNGTVGNGQDSQVIFQTKV